MLLDLVAVALGVSAATSPTPSYGSARVTSANFAARALAAHNHARARVGVRPLQWSESLASSARVYGPRLAAFGRLVHSPRDTRPGQAENLWTGTRGAYSVEAMVGYWADESRMFRAGVFPDVSTTRNWLDVSHYTQMIWPETTHVGCHLERAPARDYLICRYSPKGNRDGRWVGPARSIASRP